MGSSGDPALLTINRRVYGRLYFLPRGGSLLRQAEAGEVELTQRRARPLRVLSPVPGN
jgi:hypothetical protein